MQFQSYFKIRVHTHSPSITSVILKTLWSHTSKTTLDSASQLKSRYTALTLKSFERHNTYNSMNTLYQNNHQRDNGLAYKICLIQDSQKYSSEVWWTHTIFTPQNPWNWMKERLPFILQYPGLLHLYSPEFKVTRVPINSTFRLLTNRLFVRFIECSLVVDFLNFL